MPKTYRVIRESAKVGTVSRKEAFEIASRVRDARGKREAEKGAGAPKAKGRRKDLAD